MDDKQQTNLMAARLCWPEIVMQYRPKGSTVIIARHEKSGNAGEWDIFADTPHGAWCREQVVKALLGQGWYYWKHKRAYVFCNGFGKMAAHTEGSTDIEAIAAAVAHVSKEKES